MNLNPFSSSFNKNPADSAMPYLNKIPETISPYYNNYINSGKKTLSSLMNEYGGLISNPGQQFNEMGEGFTSSPGYQFQLNQGMNAANNAAAAGGYSGSPQHQMNASSMASNLAGQDFYNYLSHVMGLYQTGLGGYDNINQMGYGASNEYANSLGNNLMNQSSLAFQGQSNQNQANADRFNALLGAAVGVGSHFLPGGNTGAGAAAGGRI